MVEKLDEILDKNIITGLTVLVALVGAVITVTGGDLGSYEKFVDITWPLIAATGGARAVASLKRPTKQP